MKKLVRFFNQVRGLFPSRSPIGRTEFDQWSSTVFDLYNLPSTPGYRSALCAMILQEKDLYRAKYTFARAIRKAQANETAFQIMQEIRKEEKAAITQEVANGSVAVQDREV